MKNLLLLTFFVGGAWFFGTGKYKPYLKKYQTQFSHSSPESVEIGQLSKSVEALRAEQEKRKTELAKVEEDIRTAQQKLTIAKAEAEQSRCEANNSKIYAKIAAKQAQCYREEAAYSQCVAKTSKKQADDTLAATVVGAGLAVASGGSSLVVGAAAGLGATAAHGAGSSSKCDSLIPQCEHNWGALESEVLEEEGLESRPSCSLSSGVLNSDVCPPSDPLCNVK